MTKYQWEKELYVQLGGINVAEKQRAIDYYNELYVDMLENGWPEAKILKEFGSPADVALKIRSNQPYEAVSDGDYRSQNSVTRHYSPNDSSNGNMYSPNDSSNGNMYSPNVANQPKANSYNPNGSINGNSYNPNGNPNYQSYNPNAENVSAPIREFNFWKSFALLFPAIIFGIVLGALALVAIVLSLVFVVVAGSMIIGGVMAIFSAFFNFMPLPAVGVVTLAIGIAAIGIGLMLILPCFKLSGKLVVSIARGIKAYLTGIFTSKKFNSCRGGAV